MNKFKHSFLLTIALILSLSTSAFAGEKVTLCHKPGTPAEKTLEVSSSAVSAHLGHGDYTGACGPQVSAGCAAVNATVPDPQTNPNFYYFAITDLTFNPGEVLHADITILIPTVDFGNGTFAAIRNGSSNNLAQDSDFVFEGSNVQVTSSVDYTVVAGDDADSLAVGDGTSGGDYYTLQSVHLTCTPA